MDLKVLTISGSLRKESYNRKALKVAQQIIRELGIEPVEADLKELNIPIYDGDIEDAGFPESVLKLMKMVEECDVIFIASPEYNHSIPGGIKNAFDWLSRDEEKLHNKVVGLFGVSSGKFGTVRGQYHWRSVFATLNMFMLPKPQVVIGPAEENFNEDGSLSNPKTYEVLKELIVKTLEYAKKLK